MTEIDITDFFRACHPERLSASAAELGDQAGRITWSNALQAARDWPPLITADELTAWRDHVRTWGAWTEEEIRAWTDLEARALLLQHIAGCMREGKLPPHAAPADWVRYEALVQDGTVSGEIYPGDDARIFFAFD
jgi:hypothetical protein